MKRQKRSITILMTLMIFLVLPAIIQAGQLTPTAPPAPTMKSLDELYQQLQTMQMQINVLMQKTGARFLDNGNGTVTDIRTGLVWLKNANPCGQKYWIDAMAYCTSLASGQAGLTDGSIAGQWRLPSKEELEEIGTDPPTTWDFGSPTVTWTMPGAPFSSVQSSAYWSSTESANIPGNAWYVQMQVGFTTNSSKSYMLYYVWPVRSGQ